MVYFWDIFTAQSDEEKLRRKNAELDRKIGNKELEIKMIKKKLQNYRQNKFRKRMEKRPAKLKKISIEGLNRTSDSLMLASVERLFEVDNCRDLMNTSREVSKSLKSLGCFQSVNIYLDTVSDHPASGPAQFQMRIIVVEANNSPFLKLGLDTPRENVVSGLVRAGLSNVFGGGEKLQIETTKGISSYKSVNLNYLLKVQISHPNCSEYPSRRLIRILSFYLYIQKRSTGDWFHYTYRAKSV